MPWAASLKPIQGVWLGVVRLLVPTVNVLLRRAVDAGLPMCGHRFAGHVHAVSESTLNAAAIDAFGMGPSMTFSESSPTSSTCGMFPCSAPKRLRRRNILPCRSTSPIAVMVQLGKADGRQHSLCAVGSPVCPSQVLRTPHQSDGRFLTGRGAFLRFMHRMLGSLLASELLLARVRDHFLCVALFDSSLRLSREVGTQAATTHLATGDPPFFVGTRMCSSGVVAWDAMLSGPVPRETLRTSDG